MSDSTNPYELLAQYDKARKIATYLFTNGLKIEDPRTYDVNDRWALGVSAGTATPPSEAVVHLAARLCEESYELAAMLKQFRKDLSARAKVS